MFEGEFHKKWCLGGKLMGLPIGANHRQLSTCLCISSNFLNTKEGYKRIGCNTEKVFYGVVVGTHSVTKSFGGLAPQNLETFNVALLAKWK
jgi:hypothetical protein